VNVLDLDPGLASIVAFVREVHGPIHQAITDRGQATATDCAVLAGAVSALLDAMDARLPQREQQAVAEAVA